MSREDRKTPWAVWMLGILALSCGPIALGCDSPAPRAQGVDDAGPVASASEPPPAASPAADSPMSPEPPLPTIGGQSGEGGIPFSDQCVGQVPGQPLAGGRFAECFRPYPWDGPYRCCCDPDRCAEPFSRDEACDSASATPGADEDAGSDSTESRCHVEATTCAQALEQECGVPPEAVQSCFAGGYRYPCFAGPEEGTYACYCPNQDALVVNKPSFPSCHRAFIEACASECDAPSGRCWFGEDRMYRCECSNGLLVSTHAFLCEDALSLCTPACTSETGECYGPPAYWSFACQCAGESEWHVTPNGPPGTIVYGCDRQLADFCGG